MQELALAVKPGTDGGSALQLNRDAFLRRVTVFYATHQPNLTAGQVQQRAEHFFTRQRAFNQKLRAKYGLDLRSINFAAASAAVAPHQPATAETKHPAAETKRRAAAAASAQRRMRVQKVRGVLKTGWRLSAACERVRRHREERERAAA